MPPRSSLVSVQALDGLRLSATLVSPRQTPDQAVIFVHGGGVTRDEGGFFTRLADGLSEAGVASLRFDLRGHGESDGRQEDRSLTMHLNDITAAIRYVREATGAPNLSLLGASFGGGLVAYYAAKRPTEIYRLVLLNPQLNYKDRYIDQKPHWQDGRLDDDAAARLARDGYLGHSPTVRHGRAFLNDVFWIKPNEVLSEVSAPTLVVHGTEDTFVSIESSRAAARQLTCEHRLVEIDGAQHGFAVHDDPEYANPRTQEWQAFVIRTVMEWLTA